MAASEGGLDRGQPAFLMDGVSLERQPVTLFPMGGGLVIAWRDGREERLPFEALVLVSDMPDRTILGRRDAADWRLSVAPPLSERRLARLRRARSRPGRTALVYGSIAALLAGAGALTWYRGGAVLEAAAPHVPHEVTVPLGEAIAESVAEGRYCTTPEAEAALAALVQRLLPEGGTAEPITVRIADMPVSNALAAPGGQVLLTRGLIERAGGPDEVAGVLAHEIGHVEYRHATQMLLRNAGMAILLSGTGSDAAAAADALAARAMSRDKEREADDFALRALKRANVSAAGLVAYFERAGGNDRAADGTLAKAGTWLSTHPPSPERLARFRAAAASISAPSPAMPAADWAALRAACSPALPERDPAS